MGKSSKKDDIIFDSFYRGYEINNPSYSKGCFKKSLDTCIGTIEEKTEKHNKVLITRIDIRKPKEIEFDNGERKMSRVIEAFKREQERKFENSPNCLDMTIIRSTERKSNEGNTHDHLLIAANGNCIQNAYPLFQSLERHADRIFKVDKNSPENGGLVERCKKMGNKGLMINRNSLDFEEAKANAVYAASYLAKVHQKENTPKGTHKITVSKTKR
ncbi:MAG: inovirus Gp2 family protein [Desulfovibrio sp.]|uniref:YagK/YfjJ domain-containing protein n=1 Tax=Desulfovibrio sp. TaxID=885 RepID=UPI001A709F41|nr:inovirus-type Gp2 protein [Desulfovibrio sp.]MBD5418327.1 inovirus Gp2 family protein [Desulfovibrio sp.]